MSLLLREVNLDKRKERIAKQANFIFFLLTILLMVSCEVQLSSHQEKIRTDIDSVRALKINHQAIHASLPSIPKSTEVTFELCFSDKSLSNHNFNIIGSTKDTHSISDSSACLQWNEDFKFHGLNREQYYLINRKIKIQNKTVAFPIKIGLNPWSESIDDVLDLRPGFDLVSMRTSSESEMMKNDHSAKLDIHSNNSKVTAQFSDNQFVYDIKINPILILKGLDGEDKVSHIMEGLFELDVLFKQSVDDQVILTEERSLQANSHTGKIDQQITIKEAVDFNTHLYVDFKLKLIDVPEQHQVQTQTHQFFLLSLLKDAEDD